VANHMDISVQNGAPFQAGEVVYSVFISVISLWI